MGVLIALDYGTKRVGIAHSDPLQIIASPLCTLAPQEALAYLERYCRENDVETVVVGEPHHTHSMSESVEVEGEIEKFIVSLKEKIPQGMQIERFDERFTSKMASAALVAGGMRKTKRAAKGMLDMTSAAIILQDYMQWQKHKR